MTTFGRVRSTGRVGLHMLGWVPRLVGGMLVLVGTGVVGAGIILIGIGRGESYSTTAYRVGRELR